MRHHRLDDRDELARCLSTWRDRLSPDDVGVPAGPRRRAPGLRREEVGALAGVSVDYLARLEQGRASHPSASVLAPLARALRLTDDERAHLFRLAGLADPRAGTIERHITPGVQRVLDRLADVPVIVFDAAWQPVAANPLAVAMVGEAPPGRAGNIAWRHFTGAPSPMVRGTAEEDAFEREIVADLHQAVGRYPADEPLRALVEDLRRESPRFAALWDERPVAPRVWSRKTVDHAEVGRITLDCDVLTVRGSDLRIVVYTAAPGSPDAQALALLGAVGLQRFAVR